MSQSEVARLMRQIDQEYEAAKWGLEGFAIVSRHKFIDARYKQVGVYQEQLAKLVGEEQASQLVCQRYVEVFEEEGN